MLRDRLPKILNGESNHWHGASLHIYFEYKGNEYICKDSGGNNPYYASHVACFEINGNDKTDVECKYTNKPLTFAACNSSCGRRDFKNGSIVYEYLFEPLGIEMSEDGLCYMMDLRKFLEDNNIEYHKCVL